VSEREQEDARINAAMDAWTRAAAGRAPVQEQPQARARENATSENATMDALFRGGRVPSEQVPADEVAPPADELRRLRLERVAQRCHVLPEALDDVENLLDWDAIARDHDQGNAIEKAVRALIARKPYYAGVESADGGAGIGSFRGFDNRTMDQRIRDAARDGLEMRGAVG
jgi:hypothetical protein